MKALYVKGKFQFQVRDVTLRDIEPDEVLLKVSACGFCGSEIFIAQDAKEWQPIGHEVSGRVEKIGSMVKNVKVGDQVVVELSLIHICVGKEAEKGDITFGEFFGNDGPVDSAAGQRPGNSMRISIQPKNRVVCVMLDGFA